MDNKKTTTVDRILQFIDFKGISKREFSNKVGISHSLIGKSQSIGSDKIEKILHSYPEINPIWLLTGKSNMIIGDPDENLLQKKSKIIEDNISFLKQYYFSTELVIDNEYYYSMISYYERFDVATLDKYLGAEIDKYECLCDSYSELVDFLHFLGLPNFLAKKFPKAIPFKEVMQKNKEEFEEETRSLSDEKLKKILFILCVKDFAECKIYTISNLVRYIDEYKDMIKEKVLVNYDPNYSL